MKRIASTSVPNTSSSVSRTDDVSSELGSVTETRIVLTDQTKMKPFAVSYIVLTFDKVSISSTFYVQLLRS
jgi:hypothetical protein